jgi:hypothetical protein
LCKKRRWIGLNGRKENEMILDKAGRQDGNALFVKEGESRRRLEEKDELDWKGQGICCEIYGN